MHWSEKFPGLSEYFWLLVDCIRMGTVDEYMWIFGPLCAFISRRYIERVRRLVCT